MGFFAHDVSIHAFLQRFPYLQYLTGDKSMGFFAHDVSIHAFLQRSPYLQYITGDKSMGFVAHDVSTCLPLTFSLPTKSNWGQKHGLRCS
jgi:hypothetical protein